MAFNLGTLNYIIDGDTTGLRGSLAQAATLFKTTAGKMTAIGAAMTASFTVPLSNAASSVLDTAGTFESQMLKVAAISGITASDTNESFNAMRQTALDLSKATKFTATEAAQGLELFAQKGFEAQESMEAVGGSLNLATAAQIRMTDAVDVATGILNAYQMEAQEISRVNDVLTATFTNSGADVLSLQQAFKNAAASASSMGVTLEDTATALGILGDANIRGGRAGTRLKNTFLELRKKASELGVSVTDASGQLLPLATILDKLAQNGVTTNQVWDTFNKRAAQALVILMQNRDGFKELNEEVKNSAGVTAEVAKNMRQGLTFALDQLRSSWENLEITIANTGLKDFAIDLVFAIKDIVDAVSEMNPAILRAGTIMAGVLATVGPLVLALGGLKLAWGVLVPVIMDLATKALPALLFGLKGVATTIFSMTGVWIALGAVAVAAADAMFSNWEQVGPWFRNLTKALGRMFEGLGIVVRNNIEGAVLTTKKQLFQVTDWVTSLIGKIGSFLTGINPGLSAILTSGSMMMKSWLGDVDSTISDLEMRIKASQAQVSAGWEMVGSSFENAWDLTGIALFDHVKQRVTSLWDWIWDASSGGGKQAGEEGGRQFVNGFKSQLSGMEISGTLLMDDIDFAQALGTDIFDMIPDTLGQAKRKRGILQGLLDTAELPSQREKIRKELEETTDMITRMQEGATSEIAQKSKQMAQAFSGALKNAAVSMAKSIGKMIATGSSFKDGIFKVFGSLMQQVGQLMFSFGTMMSQFFTFLVSNPIAAAGIGLALIAAGSAISSAVSDRGGESGSVDLTDTGGTNMASLDTGGITLGSGIAMLHENEVVRDKTLDDAMFNKSNSNQQITGRVRGEDIWLALEEYARRNGKAGLSVSF